MQQPEAADATGVLDYLEHLVIAGIAGSSPAAADVAGRVVAVLLEALASAGGGERALGFLAPDPGIGCRLQVRTGETSRPIAADEVFDELGAADGAGTVVDAVAEGGLRRRALEVADDGAVVYLFPEADQLQGPGAEAAAARWSWTLGGWARLAPPPAAAGRLAPLSAAQLGASGDEAPAVAAPAPGPAADEPAAPAPAPDGPVTPVGSAPAPAPDVDLLVTAVRAALAEVALEIDLGAVDAAVTEAVERAVGDRLPAVAPPSTPPTPVSLDVDRLADLLTERLPPVQVDPELVDALVDALAASRAGADAPTVTALESVREQLQLQLEAFADRVAAGTRALTAAGEELAERARRADEHTDRLAEGVNAGFDRLGRQVERRLNDLQVGPPGPGRRGRARPPAGGAGEADQPAEPATPPK
ncbi:MAG TPA: hypothetical protein VFP61_11305 [Acidimicrobiales bacterium]|nr:hypothetical protein [Acidimicrobiales bacterium]